MNKITECLTYLPKTEQFMVSDFKKNFQGMIISWKKMQRKLNWSESQQSSYIVSVISYLNANPHILAHIPSLIEDCKLKGFNDDAVVLEELMEEEGGKMYLSIESQNRNESVFKLFDDSISNDYPIDIKIYKEGNLNDMFTLYRVLANGNSPNSQEKRNGYYKPLAEYVRNTSKKYKEIFDAISYSYDDKRMSDDDFIATCIGYFEKNTYGKHGGLSLSDNIDEMYRLGSIPNKKKYEKIWRMYRDFGIHLSSKNQPKFKKGMAHFISVVFNYMVSNKITINDVFKSDFFTEFNQWLRLQEDSKEIISDYKFSDNLRYRANDSYVKECLDLAKNFLQKQLDLEYLYQGGERGKHDRTSLWTSSDDKKFLRINGSVIINGNEVWFDEKTKDQDCKIPLSLEDANNTKKVEIEDINPAYKNKNASDYSNKEFATMEYNRWKWKHEPNY
jgi:hypothetical protein